MGITAETRREAYGSVDVTEMETKVLWQFVKEEPPLLRRLWMPSAQAILTM